MFSDVSVCCDVSGFCHASPIFIVCVPGEPVRMNPVSCDTFVVLPPLTAHGGVIFGKNSDRPKGEVQELIYQPAQQYTPGEQLQVNTANCVPSSQLEKVMVYGLLLKKVIVYFRNFSANLESVLHLPDGGSDSDVHGYSSLLGHDRVLICQ